MEIHDVDYLGGYVVSKIIGIYTAELIFIGYNILGHIALITGIFVTHRAFRTAREYSPNK